jgi:peroxiredoxin
MSSIRFGFLGTLALAILAISGWQSALAGDPPAVGKEVEDFELESLGGGKVKLSEATGEGPVVLVVLRGYPGYQCPACTAQVSGLASKAKAIKEAGARVLLVYPGPAEALNAKAEEFTAGKALPEGFDLLLDPDYSFTKAYNLRWDAPNETAYPSTFVISPDRKVTYAKISKTHGGRASTDEVVKALTAAK